ncbi:hypothetical protein MPSEU_000967700 [Mayamaea pseudoterrestris]|nr:hypothetical protein MPSEU_000967700 [Mayamaea pseudoterrestris]
MASPASSCRSVLDYDTEASLRRALLGVDLTASTAATTRDDDDDDDDMKSMSTTAEHTPSRDLDWVLPAFDPETTNVQSMREELKRLQVLKSYAILGADREAVFERITGLASKLFNVPIALVSLVDLGRQWFMSNLGLPTEVRETPRSQAFCAHAIMLKQNVLVVPDASLDFRFQTNPLVTGPPNIRFYAGAPLICQEGYKLGTLCIISDVARPQGLSSEEQETLMQMAELVVDAMTNRRKDLVRNETPAQLIAYTAHDIMTPLTAIQLSLSLLKDDEEVTNKLNPHHMELLATASTSSELLIRICRTAIDDLRTNPHDTIMSDEVFDSSNGELPVTKMDELVRSLHMLMEPIPKSVPLVIHLSAEVPPMVLCDDLKLFRSALNLLSSAAGRTKRGGIRLKITPHKGNTELLFECEDTAENIPVEEYQYLFQPSGSEDSNLRICLSSVASLISSLDGEYGFRPRVETVLKDDLGDWHQIGSIFWFSVPLFAPDSLGLGKLDELTGHMRARSKFVNDRPPRLSPKSPILPRVNSHHSISSLGVGVRVPVMVGDVLQAKAVADSCFRDVFEARLTPPPPSSTISSDRHGGISSIPENIVVHETLGSNHYMHNSSRNATFPTQTVSASSTNNGSGAPLSTITARKSAIATQSDGTRVHRALVVDDSLVIRKSLAMALKKLGYEAHSANDGLEGLNKMKEIEFDFVLMDFLMPVMDGLDCVSQYRAWENLNRPNSAQIIVGISAHADNDVAKQGVAAGMDDFLSKPISIKTLTEIKERDLVKERANQLDKLASIAMPQKMEQIDDNNTTRGWRKRDSGGDESMSENEDENANSLLKRARMGDQDAGAAQSICLMATDHPSMCSPKLIGLLESDNWKVVVVHDGHDTLRLLKTRNWDLVLIDDGLSGIDYNQCVSQFRAWEHENRVNRQRSVFLVSSYKIPPLSDGTSIVLAPLGFDHVIRRPIEWSDLQEFLSTGCKNMCIVR